MRPQLAFGIAVGRDRTAGGRVMPMKAQGEGVMLEEPPQKVPIVFAVELRNEFLPGTRDVEVLPPLELIPVMAFLAVPATVTELPLEQREIRERFVQAFISCLGQESLWIDPRIRLLLPEHLRVNLVEPLKVEVVHGGTVRYWLSRIPFLWSWPG